MADLFTGAMDVVSNVLRPDFFRPVRFAAVVYTLVATPQPLDPTSPIRNDVANPGHDTPFFGWFGVDSYSHNGV